MSIVAERLREKQSIGSGELVTLKSVVSYPCSKCRWRKRGRRTNPFHVKRLPRSLLTSAYIIDQNLCSHMATSRCGEGWIALCTLRLGVVALFEREGKNQYLVGSW